LGTTEHFGNFFVRVTAYLIQSSS